MYDKKQTYRNYYSHSKINDYRYYINNTYESPRQKSYLTGTLDNLNLKKKSKSDIHTHLTNAYLKPKLNNLTVATNKQRAVNYKTERSEIYEEKDFSSSKQIGKKLQNYKIKKLQQKNKEQLSLTERGTAKYQPQESSNSYISNSLSESKKNLSARKPYEIKQSPTQMKTPRYENSQRTINLQIDTEKLTEFFQNKKFQTSIPQTTKSILQYNQYNKVIKKNQMALRPFEESKQMFKKNKEIHTEREKLNDSKEQDRFEPYQLKKDNYTPKMSKRNQFPISSMTAPTAERKTVKKQKVEPLSIKDFLLFKQLGKGQNGKIYSAFHKKTGMMVALKHFQQNKVIVDYLIDEMKIQLFSQHPNVLAAFGYIIEKTSTIDASGGVYIEDEDGSKSRSYYNIYIIMEKGESNLFSLIRKEKQFTQEMTAIFTEQILQGLKYLHFHKIIHRDLKPENIIIVNGVCKITDFGWSVIGSEERETFCGTLEYVSPEVAVGSRYDNKIDIWSVGVLIFEMLTGEAPYDTTKIIQNPKQEYRKRILAKLPANISYQCKDLLSKLLKLNPKDRISIEQALGHKWIKQALTRKTMKKITMSIKQDFDKILSSK